MKTKKARIELITGEVIFKNVNEGYEGYFIDNILKSGISNSNVPDKIDLILPSAIKRIRI